MMWRGGGWRAMTTTFSRRARVFAATATRTLRQPAAARWKTARSLYQPTTQHEETQPGLEDGPTRRERPEQGRGGGYSSWWTRRGDGTAGSEKSISRPATATGIYRARQCPALESHQWCRLQCRGTYGSRRDRQIDRRQNFALAVTIFVRRSPSVIGSVFPEANNWSI